MARGEGQRACGRGARSDQVLVTPGFPQLLREVPVTKARREREQPCLFVLDTNVLMHDPSAIFRFEEHDIFLPMVVLEELDNGKKGMSEVARNVRQISRFLDELMQGVTKEQIDAGIPIPGVHKPLGAANTSSGRIFFQTRPLPSLLPETLPGNKPDNTILATTLALQKERPDVHVTLVTKDINLRIKAAVVGIHAEDYYNDKTIDDVDLLFTGLARLPDDFWETHSREMESWQESGRTFYRLTGPLVANWHPNQCIFTEQEDNFEARVMRVDGDDAII